MRIGRRFGVDMIPVLWLLLSKNQIFRSQVLSESQSLNRRELDFNGHFDSTMRGLLRCRKLKAFRLHIAKNMHSILITPFH